MKFFFLYMPHFVLKLRFKERFKSVKDCGEGVGVGQ